MDRPKQQSAFLLGFFLLASSAGLVLVWPFLTNPWQNGSLISWLSSVGAKAPAPDPCYVRNKIQGLPLDLNCVMKRAANENNTVIITLVNDAWSQPGSLLDLFLETLSVGEGVQHFVKNLVLVAADAKAFNRCLSWHPHCYLFTVEGFDFSQDKKFMTEGYLELDWRRITLLRQVLMLGYDLLFTDLDVLWLRNPFPDMLNNTADLVFQSDHYYGNPPSINNYINIGFFFARSNNRTIPFFKFWYESRKNFPKDHGQTALNSIKWDAYVNELGLKFWMLNSETFCSFCEHGVDIGKVRTMHSTCCEGGLEHKLNDLKLALGDFRNYTAAKQTGIDTSNITWSWPELC